MTFNAPIGAVQGLTFIPNTSVVTVNAAGVYSIDYRFILAGGEINDSFAFLVVSGVPAVLSQIVLPAVPGGSASGIMNLSLPAGATVQLQVSAPTPLALATNVFLNITRIA